MGIPLFDGLRPPLRPDLLSGGAPRAEPVQDAPLAGHRRAASWTGSSSALSLPGRDVMIVLALEYRRVWVWAGADRRLARKGDLRGACLA